MEDLRFLLPTITGKRTEVDSITTQAEAEITQKLDFRDFLADSYSETANCTNDGLKAGLNKSSGAAEQGDVPSEKNSRTILPLCSSISSRPFWADEPNRIEEVLSSMELFLSSRCI